VGKLVRVRHLMAARLRAHAGARDGSLSSDDRIL
jgi:hypothetical protein